MIWARQRDGISGTTRRTAHKHEQHVFYIRSEGGSVFASVRCCSKKVEIIFARDCLESDMNQNHL